jgi:tetratricopeptide (TPR) repeat protein
VRHPLKWRGTEPGAGRADRGGPARIHCRRRDPRQLPFSPGLSAFYFDLATSEYQQTADRAGQANVYRNMAQTLVADPEERVELLRAAVAISRDLDDPPTLASTLHGLALVLRWAGRFDEALAALADGGSIIAKHPGLAYLESCILSARSESLAGIGRLEEAASEAARALEMIRRDGEVVNELSLLLPYRDTLTALGRNHEAAENWRRFLPLATSPDLVQETHKFDYNADGAEIIERVKAKLAALTARNGE